MAIYDQDTGARAIQLAATWGVATDGNSWVVQAGTAANLTTTNTLLQMNASVTVSLGTASVQDALLTVQATIHSGGDTPVLLLRWTNGTNFIKLDVSGGQLRIRKQVANVFTTIATISFTQTVGQVYLFAFQVQGTTYSGKAYPVGSPDPGWLISATASDSVLATGFWGLSATTGGSNVSFSQFQVAGLRADNPYNFRDNPYGVTTYTSVASRLQLSQLFTHMQSLGLTWLRCPYPTNALDSPQGTYTWTGLDDAVSQCNSLGINICFVLMHPPTWGVDGTTGLPTPAYTTIFCTQLASRYNGTAGHGHLDAIEIWNEEFDSTSYNNTTYGAVATAGYTALRSNGFVGKIGCASELGVSGASHITTWINQLYTSAISSYFDYYSLHYYNGPNDPSQTNASFLSLSAVISTIQAALLANNDATKPVWITEFGWATSTNGGFNPINVIPPLLQSQYYATILSTARAQSSQLGAGPIQKVMFYTMDSDSTSNTEGESLTQGLSPSVTFYPAFTNLSGFIAAYYTWPGDVAQFPSATRRSGLFPAMNRRGVS